MEEIIGFKFFFNQNTEELNKRFPFVLRDFRDFSTEGFALAVYEELILCILISSLAYFFDRNFLWYIWIGAFIGCDLHFFIHLIQVSIFRRYVPACVTSLLCLPVNTLIICKCFLSVNDSTGFVAVFVFLGTALVFGNIFLAHRLMNWFTKRIHL